LLHGTTIAMSSTHLIFFGTYTRTTSRGIYAARLDDETGVLSTPILVAETPSPTWVEFSPDKKRLYAVHPSKAQVIGFEIDATKPALRPLPLPASANEAAGSPCHIAIDATGRTLLAANYGGGYVATMSIHADGTLGEPTLTQHTGHGPNPQRQEKPHVHSVTLSPDNHFAIVCDLGLDRIFTYALDPATARLTPAKPAYIEAQPCSGPRHFKFSADGRHAYNVTEMGSTAVVYDYNAATGALTQKQIISTLPPDYQAKWGSEIRIHPNGKFVYVSNRGHDSIAVFAVDPASGQLTLVEIVPSGGKVPRNFALSPNGKWLVCGHQESGDVTVFHVDPSSGKLTLMPSHQNIAMSICVAFYD
jgi:6-phosphogluconolactonase